MVEISIGQLDWHCTGSHQNLYFKTIKTTHMKKIILIALTMLLTHFGFSQTIYSYHYTSDSSIVQTKVDQTPTFTGKYFYAADGFAYPIYMSFQGHLFVERISKRTGKKYRQYLK